MYEILEITGDYNGDNIKDQLRIKCEKCIVEGSRKLLLDALLLNWQEITDLQKFFLGQEIANVFGYQIKTALLLPNKNDRIIETAAVNRDALIKLFSDLESAEEWLGS